MKKVLIVDDVAGWVEYHANAIENLFDEVEIHKAYSAKEGYDKLLENHKSPFDIIITDLQMEEDYEPKFAGEWFVEQIKTFKQYLNTKIYIISASGSIKHIAEILGVECIPKQTARNFPDSYDVMKY